MKTGEGLEVWVGQKKVGLLSGDSRIIRLLFRTAIHGWKRVFPLVHFLYL